MGKNVSFDPVKKIINVTKSPVNGVVELDIQVDLYSDGKEDWKSSSDLIKYKFPLRAVGGDPLPGSKELGRTYFLSPPWKIKPYEANHTLRVNGNFYMEDGSSAFTPVDGPYTITIESTVSNLVSSEIAEIEEIQYDSYNGQVWLDTGSSTSGTDYPAGNRENPVNNISDAVSIANKQGFKTIALLNDVTIGSEVDIRKLTFVGYGSPTEMLAVVEIDINSGASSSNCEFKNCILTGTVGGNNVVRNSVVYDLYNVSGYFDNCEFKGGIGLANGNKTTLNKCNSSIDNIIPIDIDMGGSGQNLFMINHFGDVRITNLTANNYVILSLNSGIVYLDSSISDGTIIVKGIGGFVDEATSYTTLNTSDLINNNSISDNVWGWDSNTVKTGSFGEKVKYTEESSKRALGLSHENVTIDNPEYDRDGNMIGARMRIYSDSDSVGTENNIIAEYSVIAEPDGPGKIKSWHQQRIT